MNYRKQNNCTRLNSQTSKEIVKLKKLQMVETVKRHKMQRVAGLVQSAHMDEIHQQAKFGQEVWVTKQAKTVKLKKNWTNYLNWLFCHWITLSLAVTLKKNFFPCLQLITLIWALFHLIRRFGDFNGQIRLFSDFSHRKMVSFVCS